MKHRPYNSFQLILKFIRYWLGAANGKGHGIHSPFVFALIRDVLNDTGQYYEYSRIESLRQKLENDKSAIDLIDYGAGGKGKYRSTIAAITKRTSKSRKLGRLLFRLSNYFQPDTSVELGTSMGISAAYLYAGNPNGQVITLEGAPAVAEQARQNFRKLGYDGITTITGNFDHTLEELCGQQDKIDLVYIDGNHRYEPTLRYFRQLLTRITPESVLIFDDIHWSPEMEAAWEEIRRDGSVRCTIDLFFIGLVFFSDSFKTPQHFTIRF